MQYDIYKTQQWYKGPLRHKTGALNKIIKHRCTKSKVMRLGGEWEKGWK